MSRARARVEAASRRDRARERLLQAAAELLAAGRPLRVRELARHAGVSVGYVYLCFHGKDELVRAVVERRGAALERASILLRLNPGRAPDAALASLLEAALPLAPAAPSAELAARLEPHAAQVLAQAGHPRPAAYAPRLARLLVHCARALAEEDGGAEAVAWLARVLAAGLAAEARDGEG